MKRPPTKALLPLAVLAAGGLVAVLVVVTAPHLEGEPPHLIHVHPLILAADAVVVELVENTGEVLRVAV